MRECTPGAHFDPDEEDDELEESGPEIELGSATGARAGGPGGAPAGWIYYPDLTSRTGWSAWTVEAPAAERPPAGFRPVRLGGNGPGRSRLDRPARRRLE